MKPERFKTQEIIRAYSILFIIIVLSCFFCAPNKTSVEVTRVEDTLYKLCVDDFVNLVALVGPDGVLLVDTGFDESSEQVKSILKELGGGDIKYIVNTHSDYDHIAGNSALRGNAFVLAHTRCRTQLMEYADPEYDIPFDKALFRGAYPTITFEEPVTLYFNGDEIQVIPLTGGHTDEDVIVYFKNLGVVCLGDMVSPGTFPVVKLNNGGNANSLVENVGRLISLFPEDVTFIVGHGGDTTVKEMRIYHGKLKSTIAIVQAAMKADMTVEEMKRRNILEDWSSFNDPKFKETTAETWIETIYRSSEEKTNKIKDPIIKGPYLGQKPPGLIPEVFAPDIICGSDHEGCAEFTKNGSLFLFQRLSHTESNPTDIPVFLMELKDGKWTEPSLAPFESPYMDWDYHFAPNGRILYFTSKRPASVNGKSSLSSNIWMTEMTPEGWTQPLLLQYPINTSESSEQSPSATIEGTLYFFSSREGGYGKCDIYRAEGINGSHVQVKNLGNVINTEHDEYDLFIAPDESYLIFSSDRPGGFGNTDLYISYKKGDGTWTEPKNMGKNINSGSAVFPSVTDDGRFLFFQSRRGGNGDIYWVDAGIIKELKPSDLK